VGKRVSILLAIGTLLPFAYVYVFFGLILYLGLSESFSTIDPARPKEIPRALAIVIILHTMVVLWIGFLLTIYVLVYPQPDLRRPLNDIS
jgi:hypothetical protein